jgi:hypothetical protein
MFQNWLRSSGRTLISPAGGRTAAASPPSSFRNAQMPERSGLPSPVRGVGASKFGCPLGVRGTPEVGRGGHCAGSPTGRARRTTTTAIERIRVWIPIIMCRILPGRRKVALCGPNIDDYSTPSKGQEEKNALATRDTQSHATHLLNRLSRSSSRSWRTYTEVSGRSVLFFQIPMAERSASLRFTGSFLAGSKCEGRSILPSIAFVDTMG